MADLRFNERSGRFIDAQGRFVSEATVRRAIDQIADAASSRMATAAEAVLEGRMSLGAFEAEMMQVIKLSHVAAATIAHGGAEAMTFSRYGAIGQIVRQEYDYMKSFAADIASGRQQLNRTIVSRAEMYGQASRSHYERIKMDGQQSRGSQSCRNLLHAQESCTQCRSLAASGWMPLTEMVPVGQRRCLSRCRCTLQYRQEPSEVAA